MLTNDEIINMIFPEGNAEEYIDRCISNMDKYYFTESNNPIKVNRDVLVINTKMIAIYSHLLGYYGAISVNENDSETVSLLKECVKAVADLINTVKNLTDNIMGEVSKEYIEKLYDTANRELRDVYNCVPNCMINLFSAIINM